LLLAPSSLLQLITHAPLTCNFENTVTPEDRGNNTGGVHDGMQREREMLWLRQMKELRSVEIG